jgi:hypothetical protein
MRKAMTVMIFALGLLLFLTGCDKQNRLDEELGNANQDNYGSPYNADIPFVDHSHLWVAFGIIADTHIDASWWSQQTPKTWRNMDVIDQLNPASISAGCHGIIHLGDMVDGNDNQSLVAFRQFYENDYPGHDGGSITGEPDDDYDVYCLGHRITKTVFPTIGNHDSPYYSDDPTNYRHPAEYIADRFVGTAGVYHHYNSVAYSWRWGMYLFIQLGMWAGSYEHESSTEICQAKLDWLKDWLAEYVGDSNIGVVIFQHYGWDYFSTHEGWWTSDMRDREINIFCRRDSTNQPARPYNILGIFTGHAHKQAYREISAGKDTLGNNVYFDNYIMNDAGADTDYGFSIVTLTGTELRIHYKDCATGDWTYSSKPIHVGP